MTGYQKSFNVAESPLEILIDQNVRKDGIVKPLSQWPTAHILHLSELVEKELKQQNCGFESIIRDRFKNIIGGEGPIIPRIAVKIALDDIFKSEADSPAR